MAIAFSEESKLTARNQTTLPPAVRRALHLRKGDRIRYIFGPEGEVVLARSNREESEDSALAPFLRLLAADIAARPNQLHSPDPTLVKRAKALTRGVRVNLEAALSPDDE